MPEITANKVADYILCASQESGDLITNLKLQKLLYYAQAWYLALYDKPLFRQRLEAWVHGPAQPGVYGRFKRYRWEPITDQPEKSDLPQNVSEHLDEILSVFGVENAYALELMTHREAPWIDARGGIPPDQASSAIIPHGSMKRFYGAMAGDEEDQEESP